MKQNKIMFLWRRDSPLEVNGSLKRCLGQQALEHSQEGNEECFSDEVISSKVAPQGSVLSSWLFSIQTNKAKLKNIVEKLKYADDMAPGGLIYRVWCQDFCDWFKDMTIYQLIFICQQRSPIARCAESFKTRNLSYRGLLGNNLQSTTPSKVKFWP